MKRVLFNNNKIIIIIPVVNILPSFNIDFKIITWVGDTYSFFCVVKKETAPKQHRNGGKTKF